MLVTERKQNIERFQKSRGFEKSGVKLQTKANLRETTFNSKHPEFQKINYSKNSDSIVLGVKKETLDPFTPSNFGPCLALKSQNYPKREN